MFAVMRFNVRTARNYFNIHAEFGPGSFKWGLAADGWRCNAVQLVGSSSTLMDDILPSTPSLNYGLLNQSKWSID